ncbi:MAG: queuosine precursor transporter [Bacteroidetes bacterium]|nr:queuosine precursor transporter [Bacteroidota bacterium]
MVFQQNQIPELTLNLKTETQHVDLKRKQESEYVYLILGGTFIALLVSCNLIFQKFITWNPFGWYEFKFSAGLLPYPLTFLVTDIISEIYGERKANNVVKAGLIAAFIVMGIVMIAQAAPATDFSPVNDHIFSKVFGLTLPAVCASMVAYLIAQFIDIRIFHFWKRVTKGKHLWIRNNFSTIVSQLFDTTVVLMLLCSFGTIKWEAFWMLFGSSFLFKVIFALSDTPFFYFFVGILKRRYGLKDNDELLD